MDQTVTEQTYPENSISEQLSAVCDQLSTDQIRFIVARQECSTDKEAAEIIGIKPDTVYHWKSRDKAPIEQAIRLMAGDGVLIAAHVRRKSLAKAMLVKVGGLDSEDERIRQSVATEIVDWEMGKATQRQEISGPGGKAIEVDDTRAEYHSRALDTLARALGGLLAERGDGGQGAVDAAEYAAMDGGPESSG